MQSDQGSAPMVLRKKFLDNEKKIKISEEYFTEF